MSLTNHSPALPAYQKSASPKRKWIVGSVRFFAGVRMRPGLYHGCPTWYLALSECHAIAELIWIHHLPKTIPQPCWRTLASVHSWNAWIQYRHGPKSSPASPRRSGYSRGETSRSGLGTGGYRVRDPLEAIDSRRPAACHLWETLDQGRFVATAFCRISGLPMCFHSLIVFFSPHIEAVLSQIACMHNNLVDRCHTAAWLRLDVDPTRMPDVVVLV